MSTDSETPPTLGNAAPFSWAIMSLFAWLVPKIDMEIGDYRALRKSRLWSSDDESHELGKRAIRQATYLANFIAVVLIAAAACGVALGTQNLAWKMVSIIVGLSRLMGATVLFALSWNFPEWVEVYHIRKRKDVLPVTQSIRALKFNVIWGILGRYFEVYFFLLPFYCGANAVLIPVSAVVGIIIGALVDVCVYFGRRYVRSGKHNKAMYQVFAMIFIVVLSSGALFGTGCVYINEVWGQKSRAFGVGLGTCIAWFVVGILIHFFLWRLTKDEMKKELPRARNFLSEKYNNPLGEAIAEKSPPKVPMLSKTATEENASSANNAPDDTLGEDVTFDDEEERRCGVDLPQGGGMADADDQAHEETNKRAENSAFRVGHDDDSDETVYADDPSLCSNFECKCCCFVRGQCVCRDKEKSRRLKVTSCGKWTIWWILTCFSLYFIAINIGATYQQDVVRAKLPSVKVILYENMNNIEVCAYDGDGTTGSLNEKSNITTFENKEAAHEEGFLILHCGRCGACSTWPNIKYEYTTKSFLAEASARCGRKSLFGGEDAVHSCLMSPPINWDDSCGRCWTIDILCAKAYCALNFMQSTMINTMTNFAVGANEVTAASCEEANCEAFDYPENFVACSGATRRRMNVTSSIARPREEQCANVDVSWEKLFPGE